MVTLQVNYAGRPERLVISDDEVITFPRGLVGCTEWRRFVLLSDDENHGLHILQCLDDQATHFFVTNPMLVDPAYRIMVSPDELRCLELARLADAVSLCILTARTNPPRVTANLLGPLLLNPAARLGVQLVLADSPYTTQHPLPRTISAEGEAPHAST